MIYQPLIKPTAYNLCIKGCLLVANETIMFFPFTFYGFSYQTQVKLMRC